MKRIVIDFGSGVTKIYMPGCGVVLMEATAIAVEEYEDKGGRALSVKAYGDKAKALSGRAAINTHIVRPVHEGDIVHEHLACELLQYFLEKIEITPRRARHTEVMFTVPCGIRPEILKKYSRLADDCGICMTYFTVIPFAAVLGANVTISESMPTFSLDIGHTLTNIAAFSQDGIISGLNVNVGGGNIDVQLIDELAEKYDIKVGALTAERLKITVGSLLHDDNKMTVVDGRDTKTGKPASVAINSDKIFGVISGVLDKILSYVSKVLKDLPAEVASAVMHGGIYLSGGVAKLDGVPEYISEKLKIPVNLPDEPQLAAVIGGGTILSSDELLSRLSSVDE